MMLKDEQEARTSVISRLSDVVWRTFIRAVLRYQDWHCKRAKAYLLTHDDIYRERFVGHEIIKRHGPLCEQGVSPMDPSIPDRWTLGEELPPKAWPRKN